MAFTSRRGRPKKQEQQENDAGTPELQRKKHQGLTSEPLDWLRQKGLITPQQHWCGLHFRWLYTLRYGSATVQSLDTSRVKGLLNLPEYEEWQGDRESEWKSALAALRFPHYLQVLLCYCVYQQNVPNIWLCSNTDNNKGIDNLCDCLNQLEKLWCKRTGF